MSRRSPRKRASIMCPRSFGRSNCEARVKRMAWTNTRQESDRPQRDAVSAASKRGPTTLEAFARSRTFKLWSPADPAAIRLRFFRATKRLRRLASAVAAAVATYFIAAPSPALATATPHPNASASHATQPKAYPPVALHSEVVVEVNKKGQVVRVKSTKPSKVASFNLQTYGNALQMWIRHPNGTAQVGLYRVTYDYNPKTQDITRRVSLVSAGGDWGNQQGAANVMMEMARKQAAAARQAQQQNGKLPSLNQIRGVATPRPTPAATLPP